VRDIVIAPFSNSPIRDWPETHFARLIGLLLETLGEDCRIRLTGTANQRLGVNDIVRYYPADRVINACGRMTWDEVLGALRTADCVIGNNSGIAHVAGFFNTPTVCIFGGSHQRLEWGPRGDNVVILSRVIGCSPCHLDHGHVSPYGKACLREIGPAEVAAAARMIMTRSAGTKRDAAKRSGH
jgi:ADP-heptose:LPS heptosyltransferase